MRKLTLFESSIIGFFVGIVSASCFAYIDSIKGSVGRIFSYITLMPICNSIKVPDNQKLIVSFLFIVILFVIYGLIIGIIIKKGRKTKVATMLIIIALIISIFVEENNRPNIQQINTEEYVASYAPHGQNTASVLSVTDQVANQLSGQYFSKDEVVGDLNNDGKDDVAFLIPREDKDRGDLYYITASIRGELGFVGTNLIFLGEKIEPEKIEISNGKITIGLIDHSKEKEDITIVKIFKIVNGKLKEVSL